VITEERKKTQKRHGKSQAKRKKGPWSRRKRGLDNRSEEPMDVERGRAWKEEKASQTRREGKSCENLGARGSST